VVAEIDVSDAVLPFYGVPELPRVQSWLWALGLGALGLLIYALMTD